MLVLWAGCAAMPEEKTMGNQSALPPGQHPQVFEKTITKTVSCQYLLFLPDGYREEQRRWPMIVFLHGAGERGNDLKKVKIHGPPKIVENQRDFPFIVVSPQCHADEWWSNDVLIALLDEVTAKYAVDNGRVYLTGLSMGGFGTWNLACAYPDRFAAIAPICGGGNPGEACNLKKVPVWAFHGARDKVVSLKESKKMVNAVKSCGGDARLTVYPNSSHDCWTETYENNELYEWFLEHRKNGETK